VSTCGCGRLSDVRFGAWERLELAACTVRGGDCSDVIGVLARFIRLLDGLLAPAIGKRWAAGCRAAIERRRAHGSQLAILARVYVQTYIDEKTFHAAGQTKKRFLP
jgi:hypothetical protein